MPQISQKQSQASLKADLKGGCYGKIPPPSKTANICPVQMTGFYHQTNKKQISSF
jgi:hypothetical protein